MSTKRSDDITELAKALVAFQAEVPAIPKNSDNPFFNSKYADFADVKAISDPIAARYGLAVTQWPGVNDRGDTLATLLVHTSGQFIESEMQLHLTKTDAQGQGSALTYAKRYAYMAALGLVADEDDDGNAAAQPTKPNRSGGNPQRSGGAAAKKAAPQKTADPATGEITHNLTKLMMGDIQGPDRQKFMDHIEKAHKAKIGSVPESKRAEIEKLIGEWGAGRPFTENVS